MTPKVERGCAQSRVPAAQDAKLMAAADHMRRAIALSLEMMRSGRGGPFGAVIVKDGAVVAEGSNLVTSTNDPTAHAEVVAIRRACQALGTFDLTGGRDLHQLRALPNVPQRDLLGPAGPHLLRQRSGGRGEDRLPRRLPVPRNPVAAGAALDPDPAPVARRGLGRVRGMGPQAGQDPVLIPQPRRHGGTRPGPSMHQRAVTAQQRTRRPSNLPRLLTGDCATTAAKANFYGTLCLIFAEVKNSASQLAPPNPHSPFPLSALRRSGALD